MKQEQINGKSIAHGLLKMQNLLPGTLASNKRLSFTGETSSGFDQYISDPSDPVPYLNTNSANRENEYMVADQRFASLRKDVLSYQKPCITE
ncbi:MAG: hypothetical protein WKG06_40090 [Segetibacter sp.]